MEKSHLGSAFLNLYFEHFTEIVTEVKDER
jgi:hypothetical protein